MSFTEFKSIEPLKRNRFIIKSQDFDIPTFLFRGYELYNDGDRIIFKTKIYETVINQFNPKDFFKIVGFEIHYLDPTGDVINTLQFDVKETNFKTKQCYSKNGIQRYDFIFVINNDTLNLVYNTNEKEI